MREIIKLICESRANLELLKQELQSRNVWVHAVIPEMIGQLSYIQGYTECALEDKTPPN